MNSGQGKLERKMETFLNSWTEQREIRKMGHALQSRGRELFTGTVSQGIHTDAVEALAPGHPDEPCLHSHLTEPP